MTFTLGMAIVLAIVGGMLEGVFSLPVTCTPRWRWENIWGLGLLFSLTLVPWPLAIMTVPNLFDVFSNVGPRVVFVTFLFGVGWGLGSIFWGQAIAAIGMALGVSLMMGLINVFGSPLLLAITNPHKLLELGGHMLLLAVTVTITGVILCALAGHIKEKESLAESAATANAGASFIIGFAYCVLAGILSALVNFGLVFGEPIAKAAKDLGASDIAMNNATWAVVFTGAFLTNTVYAFYLMVKKRTLSLLISEGSLNYWLGALFLGLALPLGIVLYGMGANMMGTLGPYVAFPMMLVSSILFGNLAGCLTGEWNNASVKSKAIMIAGVLVLLVAFVLFGVANKLLS